MKLETITEIKDVIMALFNWFENQEIDACDACIVVSQATGFLVAMLSGDEKDLNEGIIAIQKDMKEAAKKAYATKISA